MHWLSVPLDSIYGVVVFILQCVGAFACFMLIDLAIRHFKKGA